MAASNLELIREICAFVRHHGWRLGTAESCTGGWLAKSITDLGGVSDVFAGGFITYSNEWKMRLLNVRRRTLLKYGAVSEQTAAEMAQGLVKRYDVQVGAAITGIAGPTGGTAEKPIGLVYIGTIVDDHVRTAEHRFRGSRDAVRRQAVAATLRQLHTHIAWRKENDNGRGKSSEG